MADPLASVFEEAGRAWNVDPLLLRAVASGESGGQGDGATSNKGAQGRMQLMPDTARSLGVTDTRDSTQSIFGAAKLLSGHLDETHGDVVTALKLYQGGPNRAGWGPQNAAYPGYIMGHYQRLAGQDGVQQAAAPVPAAALPPRQAAPPPAAPTAAHEMSDAALMGLLTGGAAPAASAAPKNMPSLSDADLMDMLTRGAGQSTSPVQPATALDASKLGPTAQDAADASLAAGQARDAARSAGLRVQDAATALLGKATALPGQVAGMFAPAPDAPAPMSLRAVPGATLGPDGTPQLGYAPAAAPAPGGVLSGVGRVLSATGSGLAEGMGASPFGMAPEQTAALQRLGVIEPAAGGGSLMQTVNGAALNAVAPVVDLAGRSMKALLGGYQQGVSQAGVEVGQPGLGRDLAALPEAFPFGGPGRVPRLGSAPANRLAGPARIGEGGPLPPAALMNMADGGIPRPALAGPLSAVPEAVPANRLVGPQGAPLTRVTAEPLPPPAGTPGSMGAAATPGTVANMTPAQELAYRSTAEGQKLLEPQPVGRDLNAYVPGVNPTLAQTEQSVNVSRELKALNMASPAVSAEDKALAAAHNDARSEHFAGIAGSAVDVENARSARSAQAETNLAAAWRNKTDANAQPVLDAAAGILASPDGRRPLVRRAIESVTGELSGPDGKLLTDPEMLYGVRKHVDDLLSKESGATDPLSRRAQANLLEVKQALDGVIEQAAPGFGKYLSDYSEASRPIDAMEVLQGHEAKLYDAQNRMQYGRVQGMMRQIVDSRAAPGLNPYKSIPDDMMGNLFGLRDDLRRAATEKELAATRGSDTTQNFMDVARMGGTGLLHAGIGATLGPAGNVAMGMAKNALAPVFAARAARQQAARGMELLRPDRTDAPLRNPLLDGSSENPLRASINPMYNLPDAPQRPFSADYPSGAPADATGRLATDIEGRPLTADFIAGRSRLGGKDETVTGTGLNALATAATGEAPAAVAPGQIRGDAGRLTRTANPETGKIEYNISLNNKLTPTAQDMVLSHETGHAIDEMVGQVSADGLNAELKQIYNKQNNPNSYGSRLFGPQNAGYSGADVPREYMAEAIRAYLTNPNWMKANAPKTAAAIRAAVNDNPRLSRVVQFNSLAPAAGVGLGAAMLSGGGQEQ